MLTFLLDFWCYCVVGCNCCPFSRSWCSAFVVLGRMWPHLLWWTCSMCGLCVMILYFIESPNFEICLWLWREERVFSGNGLCKMLQLFGNFVDAVKSHKLGYCYFLPVEYVDCHGLFLRLPNLKERNSEVGDYLRGRLVFLKKQRWVFLSEPTRGFCNKGFLI